MNPKSAIRNPQSEISRADLRRSLFSTLCPTCGGPKKRSHTMCPACYGRCTAKTRLRLYDQIGNGYEEAVAAAMTELGVSTFILPPDPDEGRGGGA